MTLLARILRAVELGNEITALGNTTVGLEGEALEVANENVAAQMPGLTSAMQAEAQLFKLTQETATTVVKNIGEALHSTARKQ